MIGPALDRAAQGRAARFVAVDSSEPDLDHGIVGRSRYRWIEEQFARAGRLPGVRAAPPPAADPRHRPGAQRRARRRRHARGAAAAEREHGALRPQARALRVADREPVRRQRRHRLVDAAARPHPALLQRGRDLAGRGGHLPPLSVPRPRDDHPLLAADRWSTRRRAVPDRGRRPDATARARPGGRGALPAGRAGRDRARRPRRPRWWRRCCWAAARSCPASPTTGCRWSGVGATDPPAGDGARRPAATAPSGCSTSPTSRCSDEAGRVAADRPCAGRRAWSTRAPDFHFRPPVRGPGSTVAALAVIGTGKRVGKTAVAGHAARLLHGRGRDVVVVAMGRGGPAEPELVDGGERPIGVAELLARARAGEHAASDFLEDAALARVATVGARRCGGGLLGAPVPVERRARGGRLAAGAARPTWCCSRDRAPRCRRSRPTARCWCTRRRPAAAGRDRVRRATGCCWPIWWCDDVRAAVRVGR